MIKKERLDYLLIIWARFREKEYNEIYWSSISITGKFCEAIKAGILVRSTKHHTPDYSVPEQVDEIQEAIQKLPPDYQQIIKTEYSDNRRQRKKAKTLKLTTNNYRVKLHKARQFLQEILQ